MNKKSLIIIASVVTVLLLGGVLLFSKHHSKAANKPSSNSATAGYTQLDIQLRNGHLVTPASTYVVKPGIGLEFSIETNVYGKVGVPTSPPQTITFTQSPLVFRFKVPTKPGNYPLNYQATGSQDVIQIGMISVS
jgi:hypothetical protein